MRISAFSAIRGPKVQMVAYVHCKALGIIILAFYHFWRRKTIASAFPTREEVVFYRVSHYLCTEWRVSRISIHKCWVCFLTVSNVSAAHKAKHGVVTRQMAKFDLFDVVLIFHAGNADCCAISSENFYICVLASGVCSCATGIYSSCSLLTAYISSVHSDLWIGLLTLITFPLVFSSALSFRRFCTPSS